ncbi:hypothetical protein PBCVNEJV1_748L [Paramecium bursaria Chlorella virus NE-JV-1]|nr:hypothetical protein PBCVNEJV1_748L [Paramecium bursaria Chlorella virus NE-JV-1]
MSSDSLDVFKQSVKEYVDITNQISAAAKELNVVKRKKNELGDLILQFMQENKYDAVTSGNATILKKTATRKSALKEDVIFQAAKDFLGDAEVAKFMEKLESSREVVSKDKIGMKVARSV